MKILNTLKLIVLTTLLIISTQSCSKENDIIESKKENIALLVTMKAKLGKEENVKEFLKNGLALVNEEPETIAWFAFQINENTFGIYDTFDNESGRQAHLNGKVAKALLENADDLLESFEVSSAILPADIIATNHKKGTQNKGLLVIMEAKDESNQKVEEFLQIGKQLVSDEPETLSWYAFKLDNNRYAIFDTFQDDSGRDAHLTGKVADALLENAPVILNNFETSDIQKIDILASK